MFNKITALGLAALAAIALLIAACGPSAKTVPPAARASVHAGASAVAGMPATQDLLKTGKHCALVNLNVLRPFHSYTLAKECVERAYPGAPKDRLGTFANCEVKAYIAYHGDPAKEATATNACGLAAEKP